MALINRKSPEELQAIAEAKKNADWHAAKARQEKELAAKKQAFFDTPAGRARIAYERGDHVFQYSVNVMAQKAIIVAMVGSSTSQSTNDPSVILNSVCNEGWELVNGSFVFLETGQQSRDKFMSSGQNVAVSGATVGYYLFRRSEKLRPETLPEPWRSA